MDDFFKVSSKDILLEMQDESWFIEREALYLEDLNNSNNIETNIDKFTAKASEELHKEKVPSGKEEKKNKGGEKKVSFEKIKQDNEKLKEKFEGLASFFEKAGKEDVKETSKEDIAEKVTIRKEALQAIKTFNKFDKEVINFINRMCDCIYERDIGKEDFLKMSDRQYRDLRQKIDYDTEYLRELKYASSRENKGKQITITREQAYKYSLEMDKKYEDTMRKLSREIEETWNRHLTITVLTGALGVATTVLTFGIGLPIYAYFFAGYWFKSLRTIIQVQKFRRNYKERYNLIKLLLKG